MYIRKKVYRISVRIRSAIIGTSIYVLCSVEWIPQHPTDFHTFQCSLQTLTAWAITCVLPYFTIKCFQTINLSNIVIKWDCFKRKTVVLKPLKQFVIFIAYIPTYLLSYCKQNKKSVSLDFVWINKNKKGKVFNQCSNPYSFLRVGFFSESIGTNPLSVKIGAFSCTVQFKKWDN